MSRDIKTIVRLSFTLVLAIISITLILVWFDWKLLVVLFLFTWGNNVGSKL